jgi:hypothetical protein
MTDQAHEDLCKSNRQRQVDLEASLKAGKPFAGATFFAWRDRLYYGIPKTKTKFELSGTYIQVGDGDNPKGVNTGTAKLLNSSLDKAWRYDELSK